MNDVREAQPTTLGDVKCVVCSMTLRGCLSETGEGDCCSDCLHRDER